MSGSSDSALLTGPWRELCAGAGFTEGPVASDSVVHFVSINRGMVYRTTLDGGGFEIVVETGGGPNGAALDNDGRLWLAQNGARVMTTRSAPREPGLQIVEGAKVTSIVDERLNAPNDCAFGPDGRLWFTDPVGRLQAHPGTEPDGRIWAFDPRTSSFELMFGGLSHPNGLCFSASGDELFVSLTRLRSVLRFERRGGRWRTAGLHAELPRGEPDGMALDSDGRLWVAATTAEGLAVLDPRGDWTFIDLGPSMPTNVCFAGPDLRTVVVTAARGGRVLACDVASPGLELRRPALSGDR